MVLFFQIILEKTLFNEYIIGLQKIFLLQDTLWNKSEALENLVKMLKQQNTCENLEPGPAALLFEALFTCQHQDKMHFLAVVS